VSPIILEEQQQIGVQDCKDRKVQHAALLVAANTQRPVVVQNVIRADADDEGEDEAMPALTADFDEQDQFDEKKRNSRLEAEKILQGAITHQMRSAEDVGKAPMPATVVARAWNDAPDHCCRSWRIGIEQLALRRFARHQPDWVQHATDDPANSIDVMVQLDMDNTYTLAGWSFDLQQLMCVSQTNGMKVYPKPIPSVELVDLVGVSDSTWIMKSQRNSGTIAETDTFEKKIPNNNVEAISGSVAEDIIGAMRQRLEELPTTVCR
jgi:hypothetical protein